MAVEIQNYDPDNPDMIVQDPTDPEETVQRSLVDKLGFVLTKVEELLLRGDAEMTLGQLASYFESRGEVLDLLDDPEIQEWLLSMRERNRTPFRKFAVSD